MFNNRFFFTNLSSLTPCLKHGYLNRLICPLESPTATKLLSGFTATQWMSESRANLVLHSPHMLTSTAHVSDCHFIDVVSCLSVWQKLTAFPTKNIQVIYSFILKTISFQNEGNGVSIVTVIRIHLYKTPWLQRIHVKICTGRTVHNDKYLEQKYQFCDKYSCLKMFKLHIFRQ